jgi:hypothetical protein
MSIQWWLHSFPESNWNTLVAGGDAGAATAIRASTACEDDFDADPELTRRIVDAIAARGISYRYLDERTAERQDELVCGFFSPEGLAEYLGLEHESPDGLDRNIVEEALRRLQQRPIPSLFKRLFSGERIPSPPRVLPLFVTGRRIGGGQPGSDAVHFVLSRQEVSELRAEVEAALALKKYWSRSDNEFAARELLLAPLHAVEQKGHMLVGRLG